MLILRKPRRVVFFVTLLLILVGRADAFLGFFDSWRQPDIKTYLRKVWNIQEAAKLSQDTIRAILDATYSPGVSYWQLVGLLVRADEMHDLILKGKQADASYVGLKAVVTTTFVTALRTAGLGGVGAIAQAGAAPIVWSLETFMRDVSKAKFQKHLQAYFLLRDAPFSFSHDDILSKRSPTVEVQYTDDGWIWDIACDANESSLCRRNHFRVGGRPLDEGSAANVYGLARDLWDAANEASVYGSEKVAIGDQVRALFEDATCSSPSFQSGSSCDSGRPGICGAATWHCPRGAVKCVPNAKAGRESCSDGLDNDCDGKTDEGCLPAPTPTPSPSPSPSGCVPTEPGTEVTCTDTLDNDCDGETDCADEDCAAGPACQPNTETVVAYVITTGPSGFEVVTIDTEIDAVLRTARLDPQPINATGDLAMTPNDAGDPSIYLADGNVGQPLQIDPKTGATVALGAFTTTSAYRLARHPVLPRLYWTDTHSLHMTTLDSMTTATIAETDSASGGSVAVSSDGARVLYSASSDTAPEPSQTYPGNAYVQVLSAEGVTLDRIGVGTRGYPGSVALTPDGSRLFALHVYENAAHALMWTVSVVDIAQRSRIGEPIELGDGLFTSIAAAIDGSRVFVANWTRGEMAIVNHADGTVTRVPVGERPLGVAAHPDARRVYVTRATGNSIAVVNLDDANRVSEVILPMNLRVTSGGQFIRKEGKD